MIVTGSLRRRIVVMPSMQSVLACIRLVFAGQLIAATAAAQGAALTGAGATLPNPIYQKWFADYAATTGVKVNYQPLGSGAGVRQLLERTVDFGASDAPMSNEELAKTKGVPVLQIPMVLGAVAVAYNLPQVNQPLRLTGEVIADIFLGKITKWNDPRITSLNTGVVLPAKDVIVVHRSDGSGTTFIFTDYLSSVATAWASGPGKGKDVAWPVGIGGKGNDGVTGAIKQSPGSIGYVELAFARQNKLPAAEIRNATGRFIAPTVEATTAAAASMRLSTTTDYRVSIVNAPGPEAYPISSFSWLLVYERQTDAVKGKKLVDFIKWALHEGQKSAAALDYAPLPAAMVAQLDKRLAAIKLGAAD